MIVDKQAFPKLPKNGEESCKICGTTAKFFGCVDFNKNCESVKPTYLPSADVPITYKKCSQCGFLFSSDFDKWGHEDFKKFIYNDNYIVVDPDYTKIRPEVNALRIQKFLSGSKRDIAILDYGGGNGRFAKSLRQRGFYCASTFDPFTLEFAEPPQLKFDIITCFETLEHVPKPLEVIGEICSFLKPNGMVIFSTQLQNSDFIKQGLEWWYVSPRNGHISIFSASALEIAWNRFGVKVTSVNEFLHFGSKAEVEMSTTLLESISDLKNLG